MIFRILGAIGMIVISYGILHNKALLRNELFACGGILLLIYSISLRDPIFIPLEMMFTGASIYEIYKFKK